MLRVRFIIHDSGCESVFQIDFLIVLGFGGQFLSDLIQSSLHLPLHMAGKELVGGAEGSALLFAHWSLVLELSGLSSVRGFFAGISLNHLSVL